ncbi:DUF4179 domain-containing protein [Natronincola ferrireducens]|nr:DUF4179 domain-containing protein [Natronincola ferrireducens]
MDLEKTLLKKKRDYNNIEVPQEMEERLRNALEKEKSVKKSILGSRFIAAALILFIFVGYHFDTFAYYGKRLIGYDSIMSESLKDLNQMGRGQEIGQSYTFENGVEIILDGIMVDDNQMIAFYRIKNGQNGFDGHRFDPSFKGFLRRYRMRSAVGEYLGGDQEELIYMAVFDPPGLFERTLTFEFTIWEGNHHEKAVFPFILDRSKAMGYMIKQKINKTVEVEGIEVHFKKITATPTQTMIEGSVDNIIELIRQSISGDQTRIPHMRIKLLADGKAIAEQGSSMTTNMKGMSFSSSFDPLPANIEKLEIQLEELSIMERPNLSLNLSKKQLPYSTYYKNREIKIEEMVSVNGETHITIETEENMLLLDVILLADGESLKFIETQSLDYDKTPNGGTHKRKIKFQGNGDNLELKIGTIIYTGKFEGFNSPIEIK